jgi:toxin ParE1/3/4
MYAVTFLAEAIKDAEIAAKWYAEIKEGLDKSFIDQLLLSVEKLRSGKVIYGPVHSGLSRIFLKRFPYVVYFKMDIQNHQIVIFGVLHRKQSNTAIDKRKSS